MRVAALLIPLMFLLACQSHSSDNGPKAAQSSDQPVGPAITKILESKGEVHIGGRFGSVGAIVVDSDWLETLENASALTHARGVMTMQVHPETRVVLWSPGENPWVRVDEGRILAYVHSGVEAHFFGRGITAVTDGKSASIIYIDAELLDPYVSWYEGNGEISNGLITQPTGLGYAAAVTYEAREGKFFPARRDFYTPADVERIRRIALENAVR